MGELGTIRRYSYWSERRIREIASENSIGLDPRWNVSLRTPALAPLPQAEFTSERPGPHRHEVAVKMERAIGQLAVEDFVTPPPATFAKGCGKLTFGIYRRWHGDEAVILHTRAISSTGCRVEVILFGSIENCAGYLGASEVKADYWRSSSTWAIEEFIEHRGTKPAPIYDDDEAIAVEILRVINNEGMTRGKAFQRYPAAEWFAEVYKDVELDKDRWHFKHGDTDVPEPVDRIVIGAPLWVRSASRLRASAASAASPLGSALMREWLSRTQLRQRPMLAVYAGLLILIAAVIGAAALSWLTSGSGDRLAVIGNLLSLGTLLLALVAGIVALAAYSAATGLPNLKLQFSLPFGSPNEVSFVSREPGSPVTPRGNEYTARIRVGNRNRYAARSPAVVIEFRGAGIESGMYTASQDWTPTARRSTTGDIIALQWDGGPNYSIHGNSIRVLPDLNLQGLHPFDLNKPPEMIIRLLADGYDRPSIRLPIQFITKAAPPSHLETIQEWWL